MKRILGAVAVLAFTGAFSLVSFADDAKGPERVVEGTGEVVTSPGEIVEGVAEETEDKGAVGVVTGTAKGTVNAAGQAVEGAADIATGVVETVLDPVTDD
ncbi:MAG TPA: hypothetical protein VIC61_05100 [Gammaproteobacteria bacterium]|jgi:hypothetical protein